MPALIALAAFSLGLAIVGLLAGVRRAASAPRARNGEHLTPPTPLAQGAATGRSPSSRGEVDARPARGMAAIKQRVRARDWRAVWPSLLVIGGILGLMVFGGIASLIALEAKAIGILMLLLALFAVVSMAIDYRRG